jgi:hypothetical protein
MVKESQSKKSVLSKEKQFTQDLLNMEDQINKFKNKINNRRKKKKATIKPQFLDIIHKKIKRK